MILSGGGTAGHIYPALALADELRARGVDLSFLGTPSGPEARLVPEAGIEFIPVDAAGFDRARPLTLLTSSARVAASSFRVGRVLAAQSPDLVICFGGYVTIPVALAARRRKIPLVLHEQNSVMGMTNRFLASRAAEIFLTYPNTQRIPVGALGAKASEGAGLRVSGNPVRRSVLEGDADAGRALFSVPKDALMLLVFGGSRGARRINQAILALAPKLLQDMDQLHIVHAAGPAEYEAAARELQRIDKENCGEIQDCAEAKARVGTEVTTAFGGRYHLLPYLERMGDSLAAADLAVTRSGATSIAELCALGVPSLLVPYSYATDDHQTKNAEALSALGGARLITDDQLESSTFETSLQKVLSDKSLRATMAKQARALGKADAAARMADVLEALAGDDKNRT